MKYTHFFLFTLVWMPFSYAQSTHTAPLENLQSPEPHLAHVKQLTFGGDNAEAYWSFDSKAITFQSNFKNWGVECDQIFASL